MDFLSFKTSDGVVRFAVHDDGDMTIYIATPQSNMNRAIVFDVSEAQKLRDYLIDALKDFI